MFASEGVGDSLHNGLRVAFSVGFREAGGFVEVDGEQVYPRQ
jgi:uncharacterized protein YlxW (UPF0749 family)